MQATIDTTDQPPPAAPPAYAGWYRSHKGRPFEKLAEAATYADCLNRLLDVLDAEGQRGGDSVILPIGQDANQGASTRPMRRQRF